MSDTVHHDWLRHRHSYWDSMHSCSAGGCITWWGWHPPLPPCHSRSRDCDGGLVMLGLRCAWLWYIKSITMGCQSRKSFLVSGFERHYCGMPLHKFRHSGDEVGYWVHLRTIPYNQPQEKERIEESAEGQQRRRYWQRKWKLQHLLWDVALQHPAAGSPSGSSEPRWAGAGNAN